MRRRHAISVALLATVSVMAAIPVWAHHSSAAYDTTARATLSGIVKEFDWENPHCWISMMVPDGKGGQEQWNLEGGSVSILVRNGWRATTIAPGDKVKVLISPKKDKTPGGEFYTVLEKNGQPLSLTSNQGS